MFDIAPMARRLAALAGAFAGDRRGATAVEYGLLAMMIVIALVGILTLGTASGVLSDGFDKVSTSIGDANGG